MAYKRFNTFDNLGTQKRLREEQKKAQEEARRKAQPKTGIDAVLSEEDIASARRAPKVSRFNARPVAGASGIPPEAPVLTPSSDRPIKEMQGETPPNTLGMIPEMPESMNYVAPTAETNPKGSPRRSMIFSVDGKKYDYYDPQQKIAGLAALKAKPFTPPPARTVYDAANDAIIKEAVKGTRDASDPAVLKALQRRGYMRASQETVNLNGQEVTPAYYIKHHKIENARRVAEETGEPQWIRGDKSGEFSNGYRTGQWVWPSKYKTSQAGQDKYREAGKRLSVAQTRVKELHSAGMTDSQLMQDALVEEQQAQEELSGVEQRIKAAGKGPERQKISQQTPNFKEIMQVPSTLTDENLTTRGRLDGYIEYSKQARFLRPGKHRDTFYKNLVMSFSTEGLDDASKSTVQQIQREIQAGGRLRPEKAFALLQDKLSGVVNDRQTPAMKAQEDRIRKQQLEDEKRVLAQEKFKMDQEQAEFKKVNDYLRVRSKRIETQIDRKQKRIDAINAMDEDDLTDKLLAQRDTLQREIDDLDGKLDILYSEQDKLARMESQAVAEQPTEEAPQEELTDDVFAAITQEPIEDQVAFYHTLSPKQQDRFDELKAQQEASQAPKTPQFAARNPNEASQAPKTPQFAARNPNERPSTSYHDAIQRIDLAVLQGAPIPIEVFDGLNDYEQSQVQQYIQTQKASS